MNKLIPFFSALILLIDANPCLAQFNDVRKKTVRARVYSLGEYREGTVYKETHASAERSVSEAAESPSESAGKNYGENYGKKEGNTARDSAWLTRPLFSHPLERGVLDVTSHYGYREDPFTEKKRFHKGTDFRTQTENVYAMMPGRIKKIGYDKRLGNYIRLEHGDWEVTYAHLYTVRGQKGDTVEPGHSVGISGSTGRSTGEHLHVSVKYKGDYIDPYPFVLYVVEQTKLCKAPGGREVERNEPTPNAREK